MKTNNLNKIIHPSILLILIILFMMGGCFSRESTTLPEELSITAIPSVVPPTLVASLTPAVHAPVIIELICPEPLILL